MAGDVQADLTCNGTWTYYRAPRHVAGSPFALDVVKCRLKPLTRADYGVTFTDAQWAQLEAAFPTGVCDYSQPGVSQQPPKARWLTFADGPGGRPLGPAPAASEFADGTVGGTVPPTLSLTLGPPATFGAFVPGVADTYEASTTRERDLERGRRRADGVRPGPSDERRVHAAAAAAGGDHAERVDRPGLERAGGDPVHAGDRRHRRRCGPASTAAR